MREWLVYVLIVINVLLLIVNVAQKDVIFTVINLLTLIVLVIISETDGWTT